MIDDRPLLLFYNDVISGTNDIHGRSCTFYGGHCVAQRIGPFNRDSDRNITHDGIFNFDIGAVRLIQYINESPKRHIYGVKYRVFIVAVQIVGALFNLPLFVPGLILYPMVRWCI